VTELIENGRASAKVLGNEGVDIDEAIATLETLIKKIGIGLDRSMREYPEHTATLEMHLHELEAPGRELKKITKKLFAHIAAEADKLCEEEDAISRERAELLDGNAELWKEQLKAYKEHWFALKLEERYQDWFSQQVGSQAAMYRKWHDELQEDVRKTLNSEWMRARYQWLDVRKM
jgi:hypothetical protein